MLLLLIIYTKGESMKRELKLAVIGLLAAGCVYSAVPTHAAYIGSVVDTYKTKYDKLAGKWVNLFYEPTYKELRVNKGYSETGDYVYNTDAHLTWFSHWHRITYRTW